jgi:hypothetical protein
MPLTASLTARRNSAWNRRSLKTCRMARYPASGRSLGARTWRSNSSSRIVLGMGPAGTEDGYSMRPMPHSCKAARRSTPRNRASSPPAKAPRKPARPLTTDETVGPAK